MGRTEGEDNGPALNYTVSIQPEAQAEIQEAYIWYEGQSIGLGAEFMRAVEASLALIHRHPQAYARVQREVRRAVLRRFPYGLFYFVDGNTIVVIACFHGSRDPAEWRRRVP